MVDRGIPHRLQLCQKLGQARSKVGWIAEDYLGQRLAVKLQDGVDSMYLSILHVAVEGEAVAMP